MTLQEQIKSDMVNAMKSKDQEVLGLLRVVSGEFPRTEHYQKVSKDLPDNEVIKILRKMSENAKEQGNENEVKILGKYLPEMLDSDQIGLILTDIIATNGFSGMKDMGKVMGKIKTLPIASQIDGKIASDLLKKMLS